MWVLLAGGPGAGGATMHHFAVGSDRVEKGSDWRVLDPTGSSSAPSWSPDGAWITYNPGQRLRVVSAAGGMPTSVDLRGADVRDPDWSP